MHVHRLEKVWLAVSALVIALFIGLLGVNAATTHFWAPSGTQTCNPQQLGTTFPQPGVKQTGPNSYEADIIAQTFSFTPNVIKIPVGSTLTFQVTSKDVIHGFEIPGTDVNMMIEPGYINVESHKFTKPGTYLILCNEYCGAGHQLMSATVEVQ